MADEQEGFDLRNLSEELERISPTDLITHMQRDRPHDGQPHTQSGERGRTPVEGLTYRDVFDCFVIACHEASGLPYEDYPTSIYELPWDDMDPIAVAQNQMVLMEKRQGIFPNLPGRRPGERGAEDGE